LNKLLKHEKEAAANGFRFILGIDEAGRGPLAGPVVAAAVYLTSLKFKRGSINDSKQMTAAAREEAFHTIFNRGFVGIGVVNETVIDEVNILNASYLAMELAVLRLARRLSLSNILLEENIKEVVLLIDGNSFKSQLPYSHKTIVDGDAKSLSIACASIVAKVYRDRLMHHYDQIFPQYGFKQHKGYATRMHRQAILDHGPSWLHRRSFTWNAPALNEAQIESLD
jgi:ribonuclease HII